MALKLYAWNIQVSSPESLTSSKIFRNIFPLGSDFVLIANAGGCTRGQEITNLNTRVIFL